LTYKENKEVYFEGFGWKDIGKNSSGRSIENKKHPTKKKGESGTAYLPAWAELSGSEIGLGGRLVQWEFGGLRGVRDTLQETSLIKWGGVLKKKGKRILNSVGKMGR